MIDCVLIRLYDGHNFFVREGKRAQFRQALALESIVNNPGCSSQRQDELSGKYVKSNTTLKCKRL